MTYPGGKKQSWTYDNQGRTATFTDTAGVTTTYTHTALGQIHTAKTSTGDNVDYGYDALGRLDKTTRGNGITTTVEWDDRNEPAVITHARQGRRPGPQEHPRIRHPREPHQDRHRNPETFGQEAWSTAETRLRLRHRRPAHLIHNHKRGRHGHRDRLQTERRLRHHRRDPHGHETRRHGGEDRRHPGTRRGRAPDQADHPHPGRKDQRSGPGVRRQRQPPQGRRREHLHLYPRRTPRWHHQPGGTITGHSYWPTGLRKTTSTTARVGWGARAGRRARSTAYWTPQAPGASVPETAVEETPDGTRASHLLAATRETRTLLTPDGKPTAPEGAETGYLLHDRLGTATHLTDSRDGTITTGYTYTDYGTTTRTPTRQRQQ